MWSPAAFCSKELASAVADRSNAHRCISHDRGSRLAAIACAGQSVQIPVTIKQAAADRPISFKLDVMPVFMRAGCNTGSCHGAARGKDGFRLSLFGFAPDGDHFRLTRELSCRRINLAIPAESLLVEKAIGAVPHTGGKRFELASEYGQTLIRWLDAGAPLDSVRAAVLHSVEPALKLQTPVFLGLGRDGFTFRLCRLPDALAGVEELVPPRGGFFFARRFSC